ncbi:MAG: hypothetical protein JO244_04110 [Solirubrobacterales bacterium]|nr:hypothetical protein [Solirubrobacterales bacterium]
MTSRALDYLARHALAAAALICSLLALAGSSYAAFTISGSQIQNHTINPAKLNPKFINGNVRAWAIVAPNGRVIASAGRPRVTAQLSPDLGGYLIRWGVAVQRCATVAGLDLTSSPPTERVSSVENPSMPFTAGYAVASTGRPSRPGLAGSTFVQTFTQTGQPDQLGFNVAVIC